MSSKVNSLHMPLHIVSSFCSEITFSSGKVALLANGAAVVQVHEYVGAIHSGP